MIQIARTLVDGGTTSQPGQQPIIARSHGTSGALASLIPSDFTKRLSRF